MNFKQFWKSKVFNKSQSWIDLLRSLENLLNEIDISDEAKSKVMTLLINYSREHPGAIDIEVNE